ncbi:MAG: hypothetical protein WCW36_02590 [Candidatus Paceibacterota bacterium]|jgi:hypothetical protein
MDPELRRELDEIHALVKDNHQMLRAIRRGQWVSAFMKVVFWIFIIAAPLYIYQQYLQPTVAKFSAASGVPTSGFFGLPTFAEMQKLINSLQTGQ